MTMGLYYPFEWQLNQWERLLSRYRQGLMPHAVLISGPEFVGKENFSLALAQTILCVSSESKVGDKCGQCKGCMLSAAGNHPDFVLIKPEAENKAIKISQIRAISSFVFQSAQQGGWRVIMVCPVEKMSIDAKVALLKILEEPPGKIVFVIMSHELGRVPSTIVSRCHKITLPVPPENKVLEWLHKGPYDKNKIKKSMELANGRPLLAEKYLTGSMMNQREEFNTVLDSLWSGQVSPIEAAQKCHQKKTLDLIDWYRFRVHSMAKEQLDGVICPQIFFFYDKLSNARNWLIESNPNPKLLWEELFFDWVTLSKRIHNR